METSTAYHHQGGFDARTSTFMPNSPLINISFPVSLWDVEEMDLRIWMWEGGRWTILVVRYKLVLVVCFCGYLGQSFHAATGGRRLLSFGNGSEIEFLKECEWIYHIIMALLGNLTICIWFCDIWSSFVSFAPTSIANVSTAWTSWSKFLSS